MTDNSGRANRVAPDGALLTTPDRGLFWGNRGPLLDRHRALARHSSGRRWIICQLEFNGRQRVQWQPGRLTELYFLDEPTALSAGHRPCGTCRHDDYQSFVAAWLRAHSQRNIDAQELDRQLHQSRLERSIHRTHVAALDSLPDGCIIEHHGDFWLVRGSHLHAWTSRGYERPTHRTSFPDQVTVRTPRETVATLRAGYTPQAHPSVLPNLKEAQS